MKKLHFLPLFLVAYLCTLLSCSHAIKVEITRQSSELNHCEIIFGTDLNSLKLENAILLQTGVIDTTDEHRPLPVAIVIINQKEIILKLVNHKEIDNETSRIYEGEGFKINLSYKKEKSEHNETIFNGKFIINNKNLSSDYDIVGTICNL